MVARVMLYEMPFYLQDCDDTLTDEDWKRCLYQRVSAIFGMHEKLMAAGLSPQIQAMEKRLEAIAARRGQYGCDALKAALVARRLRGG